MNLEGILNEVLKCTLVQWPVTGVLGWRYGNQLNVNGCFIKTRMWENKYLRKPIHLTCMWSWGGEE